MSIHNFYAILQILQNTETTIESPCTRTNYKSIPNQDFSVLILMTKLVKSYRE